jgi:thiol-disulfide isomerase/thioredoxin
MRRFLLFISALLLVWQPVGAATDGQFDLSDYDGKVVIVDFWASWCVPCRRSFPWYNAMHDKYGDQGLIIIAVNLDAEREAAEKFLAEYPPRFEVVYDETKDLAREFEVVAMPTSYLIGRNGAIRERHFGFKVKKQDEYEAAIVAALGVRE